MDSLGIQIIATFNSDLKNIDKALLRKERLTAIYEFGALHFNKANQLLKHLNIHDFETMQPMILADIFNYNETNFNRKREKSKRVNRIKEIINSKIECFGEINERIKRYSRQEQSLDLSYKLPTTQRSKRMPKTRLEHKQKQPDNKITIITVPERQCIGN